MTTGVNPERRADFFVHPDYHRMNGGGVTEQLEQYEDELLRRIELSPLPILVYDSVPKVRSGEFWDLFPSEHRFPTVRDNGVIAPYDMVHGKLRINRLLEEREILQGIVHGSYLSQCVRAFKSNMFASEESGILYARDPFGDHPLGEIHGTDNVKYGVVLRYLDGYTPEYLQNNWNEHSACPPQDFAEDYQIYSAGIGSRPRALHS